MIDRVLRYWFYFRMGYGTYLSLIIGYFGNLIVIYKLAAQNIIPIHLSLFLVVSALLGGPIGAFIGWLHVKRTRAYSTDVVSNPYNQKILPGKEAEVFLPLWLLTAKILMKMLDDEKPLTFQDKARFEGAIRKAEELLSQ